MNQHLDSQSSIAVNPVTRRAFLQAAGLGAAALGLPAIARAAEKPIQGFEQATDASNASRGWQPVSDRKIRVGLVGYGVCKFAAAFGFQDHPNVEVSAVSDLIPERCAELAKVVRCTRTYPSLEALVKDDRLEAVFVATDAPSHARHCLEVLKHGKHVASAVPAVFGSLAEADQLLAAVKLSRRKYMMFETSCFHEDLAAMRRICQAGGFGPIMYAEGEYYQTMKTPSDPKHYETGSPRRLSRRRFMGGIAVATAGFQVVPGYALGLRGATPPSGKLNMAGVGVSGQGGHDISQFTKENIVALCDVDWAHAAGTFKKFPQARQWKDYRKMLEQQKDLDAVVVATPDHVHAFASMAALRLGKPVYCRWSPMSSPCAAPGCSRTTVRCSRSRARTPAASRCRR